MMKDVMDAVVEYVRDCNRGRPEPAYRLEVIPHDHGVVYRVAVFPGITDESGPHTIVESADLEEVGAYMKRFLSWPDPRYQPQ